MSGDDAYQRKAYQRRATGGVAWRSLSSYLDLSLHSHALSCLASAMLFYLRANQDYGLSLCKLWAKTILTSSELGVLGTVYQQQVSKTTGIKVNCAHLIASGVHNKSQSHSQVGSEKGVVCP